MYCKKLFINSFHFADYFLIFCRSLFARYKSEKFDSTSSTMSMQLTTFLHVSSMSRRLGPGPCFVFYQRQKFIPCTCKIRFRSAFFLFKFHFQSSDVEVTCSIITDVDSSSQCCPYTWVDQKVMRLVSCSDHKRHIIL